MRKKTLVYIDDDAEDREIFCEAVSLMEDIDCIAVSSCDSAMKTMKAQHVDIIFLDYRMPLVDGPQCLAKLNVLRSNHPGLRIYLYATFMQDFEKENCRKLGALDCFEKPANTTEIEQLVKLVLEPDKA